MNETTLQMILKQQEVFQKKFGYDKNMSTEEKMDLVHTHAAFVVEETYEMLRELPFHKPWASYSDLTHEQIDEKIAKAKGEWIDVFIFLSNIAVFLEMDEAEIRQLYLEKNKLNIKRQEDPSLGYVKE